MIRILRWCFDFRVSPFARFQIIWAGAIFLLGFSDLGFNLYAQSFWALLPSIILFSGLWIVDAMKDTP